VFLLAADIGKTGALENEDTVQTVEYLISVIAGSNLTFIRNGQCYGGKEAAKHLSDKYDYFRSQIKTPETFIDLCATGSIVSGEPYMVITAQGTVPLAKWLRQILAEHRKIKGRQPLFRGALSVEVDLA
jgi:hypothetical protein